MPTAAVRSTAAPTHPGRFRPSPAYAPPSSGRPILDGAAQLRVRIAPGAQPGSSVSLMPWRDITADLYHTGVTISPGRANEQSTTPSTSCTLTLLDPDGRYNRHNPASLGWPGLTAGCPLWIEANPGAGWVTRFLGEIDGLEPRHDKSLGQTLVQVQAYGVRYRLDRPSTTTRSALTRGIVWNYTGSRASGALPSGARYWPMEDGANATSFAEAQGNERVTPTGTVAYASASVLDGSLPLPTFAAGAGVWAHLPGTATTSWRAQGVLAMGSAPASTSQVMSVLATGTVRLWIVSWDPSGPTLRISGLSVTGVDLLGSGGISMANLGSLYGGRAVMLVLDARNNSSGGVDWEIQALAVGSPGDPPYGISGVGTSGTVAASSCGAQTAIQMVAPVANTALGHLLAAPESNSYTDLGGGAFFFDATDSGRLAGDANDSPLARVLRAAYEDRIGLSTADTQLLALALASNTNMGPRPAAASMATIDEAVTLDGGTLTDGGAADFDDLMGLYFAERASRYGTPAALTVDAAAGQCADLTLLDNTRLRVTDETVTAAGGAQARYDSGLTPRLEAAKTVNSVAGADDELRHVAAWDVAVATADEPRFAPLTLALHAHPELIAPWCACLPGSRVDLANVPPQISPVLTTVSLIIEGYSETITTVTWDVTIHTAPQRPYRVAVLGSDAGQGLRWRLDSATATLATAVSAGTTLVSDPMETGVASWTPTSATVVQSSTVAYNGTFSALLTVTGAPATALARYTQVSVTAGAAYWLRIPVYSAAGYSSVQIAVDWFDGTGAYLSTSALSPTAVAAATWTVLDLPVTAPAGAAGAEIGPTLSGSPAAGTALFFDAVTLTPAAAVATSGPLWTTDAGQVPFDVGLAGWPATVSAVSGTSSPQFFRLAQIAGPAPVGTPVRLWRPPVIAR